MDFCILSSIDNEILGTYFKKYVGCAVPVMCKS